MVGWLGLWEFALDTGRGACDRGNSYNSNQMCWGNP